VGAIAGLLLLLLLPGCFEYDEVIRIRPDGSGEILVHYSAPGPASSAEASVDPALPLPFDEEGVRSLFASGPLLVRSVRVRDEEGRTVVDFTLDFEHLEDLRRLRGFPGHRIEVTETETSLIVTRTIDPVPGPGSRAGEGGEGLLRNLLGGIAAGSSRLAFRVELPMEVVSTDGELSSIEWEENDRSAGMKTITWRFTGADLATTGLALRIEIARPPWVLELLAGLEAEIVVPAVLLILAVACVGWARRRRGRRP
jgi:hypothetical protein